MHIVGLLGMPRRVYTYPAGLGWDAYNLAETVGSYVLTAGLVLIAANLVVSRFRGAPSGPDPFHGGTLEWATSSPPPHYNFPAIPKVTSPYPNWDEGDRATDSARLDRGVLTLEEGHETPASTVRDGLLDEVLEMPSESPWPLALGACATVAFALLLTSHFVTAGILGALAALALAAWHSHEPEEG